MSIACCGHTLTQGASPQCWHIMGTKADRFSAPLAAVIDRKHAEPRDAGAVGSACGGGRNVVLHRAGDHARSAAVAAIDIDRHAITAGGFPFGFRCSYAHHPGACGRAAHILNPGRATHLDCAFGNRRVDGHFHGAFAEARLQNGARAIAHAGGGGIGGRERDRLGASCKIAIPDRAWSSAANLPGSAAARSLPGADRSPIPWEGVQRFPASRSRAIESGSLPFAAFVQAPSRTHRR